MVPFWGFIRGYGGIGRRAGFRFLCRKACGFDPHYPHKRKKHVGSYRTNVLFLIMVTLLVTLLNFQTALTAALYSISRNCTALGAPVSG